MSEQDLLIQQRPPLVAAQSVQRGWLDDVLKLPRNTPGEWYRWHSPTMGGATKRKLRAAGFEVRTTCTGGPTGGCAVWVRFVDERITIAVQDVTAQHLGWIDGEGDRLVAVIGPRSDGAYRVTWETSIPGDFADVWCRPDYPLTITPCRPASAEVHDAG